METIIRVGFVAVLVVIIALLFSCSFVVDRLGGAFKSAPEKMEEELSDSARLLAEEAFIGLQGAGLLDYHTHMLGLGTLCVECFVNPSSRDTFSPLKNFRFRIYLSSSGVKDLALGDQQYLDRLVKLVRYFGYPLKSAVLAFDKHYNHDGTVNLKKTELYVPNSYVYALSQQFPDMFIPVVSIHPYREDALEELARWGQKGVRMVKWLPNAMGIDPSHPKTTAFYRMMRSYDMILLSHTGDEKAVWAEEDQKLGNPLLLRNPLDQGVKVIMAHCASLGTCEDQDSPTRRRVSCFDLFLRLISEKRYAGQLYGEISAMMQYNRMPDPLLEILHRPELQNRLVNGSDYPLVAVNVLIRTGELANDGFITQQQRLALNEIYDFNPLLFDFVLKRTVRHPVTGQRLAPEIFTRNLFDQLSDNCQ